MARPRKNDRVAPALLASAIEVGMCDNPNCRAVHIQLKNKDGDLLGSATIGIDDVPDFVNSVEKISYRIDEAKK